MIFSLYASSNHTGNHRLMKYNKRQFGFQEISEKVIFLKFLAIPVKLERVKNVGIFQPEFFFMREQYIKANILSLYGP